MNPEQSALAGQGQGQGQGRSIEEAAALEQTRLTREIQGLKAGTKEDAEQLLALAKELKSLVANPVQHIAAKRATELYRRLPQGTESWALKAALFGDMALSEEGRKYIRRELRSEKDRLRLAACEALEGFRDSESDCAQVLTRAVHEPREISFGTYQLKAIKALAGNLEARDALFRCIYDAVPAVKLAAAKALSTEQGAVAELRALLFSSDEEIRASVVSGLEGHPDAEDELRDIARDPEETSRLRLLALRGLDIGLQDQSFLIAIIGRSDSNWLRVEAAKIYASNYLPRKHLLPKLNSKRSAGWVPAAIACRGIPEADKRLIAGLGNNFGTQLGIAIQEALQGYETASDKVLEMLEQAPEAFKSPYINALAGHSKAESRLLEEIVGTTHEHVIITGIDSFAKGSRSQDLSSFLSHHSTRVRKAAAEYYYKLPGAETELARCLGDKYSDEFSSDDLKAAAARALSSLPGASLALEGLITERQAGES